MATGQNTTASALAASAFGDGTIASGTQSFAAGFLQLLQEINLLQLDQLLLT